MSLNIYPIDKSWSLFLDRDGVINKRLLNDYVKTIEEFEFLPGVPEAIKFFKNIFAHVLVVTNQQGVSKGLMTENDLHKVHQYFVKELEKNGTRVDKIYYCTDLAGSGSLDRKPEIGMALKAQADFSDIDFSKSIMAGDSKSDMEFGRRAGMKTVFIGKKIKFDKALVDEQFQSLVHFAEQIKNNQ